MLCSACQRIFRGRLIFEDREYSKYRYSKRENHHMTAQSFAHAISQKCYICTSVLQQYQADRRDTHGPQQLAEVLRATKYYLTRGAKDDNFSLYLWILSFESPLDDEITGYDDCD